jgi:hypothetical protein
MDNPMPKKGNYNQDYYKVRGKEPGNQDVFPEKTKAAPKRSAARKPKAQKSTTRKAG